MERIRRAFERSARALTLRPALGRSTGVSRTRVRQGLTCDIEERSWKLVADMPEQAGGSAAGPTPGVLGRAALGSCLAMTYMMHAAKLGVPISALEVEVQADYEMGRSSASAPRRPATLRSATS
jgi:OsmC-like protein